MPAGAQSVPILTGQALNTYYGQSHILRNVSIAIATGETIGLMGRNGMGKTTLIRTLMGLVRARSGTVTHRRQGCDTRAGPHHRPARHCLRAGGTRHLRYAERGREHCHRGAARHRRHARVDRARGYWSCSRALASVSTNRGDQLSGGEQQMLAMARALVTNPRLLILDEATEGLAPIVRDEIWKTISLIRATGIATLIVDKTVAAVTELADRVVILVKGEVVLDGSPGELTANPELMHRHLGV